MNKLKNKILFIIHYPPPVHGAALIGDSIKRSKVINGSFKCSFINLSTSASINDIGHNNFKKFFKYLGIISILIRELIISRPNLSYITPVANGIGFYKDFLIILIVKIFRIKTVFHYHNKGISDRQGKLLDDLLYKFTFRNSDVILLSKRLHYDIKKYVPEKRVHFCTNGIPEDGFKNFRLKDNSKGRTGTAVGMILLSNLIESKGIFILIEACKILKEKGLNFHCVIAGENGDLNFEQVQKRIISSGISSLVTVSGGIYGRDKFSALDSSDIFVLPTFYPNECMPLVLLEAMQCSLPVISTYEGAIQGVVEDGITGFLVPQRDAVALADKLEILIQDPELRARMGQEGRAKYEREFTLERFEMRMVDILQEVSGEKKSINMEPYINILGYRLYTGSKEFFSNGVSGVVNCLNPHSHVVALRDPAFLKSLRKSDYLVADGVGIQLAATFIRGKKIEKIAGSDVHMQILKNLSSRQGRCFYLGSSEEILSKIEQRLAREFTGITAGFFSPPYKKEFSVEDNLEMVEAINDFAPDVLFVGMTAPKQEKWVYENRKFIKAPVICCIGAVFDFYAGTVKRPGKFWISLGLEWLPRLLQEPRRLWRRTLISTPLFLWYVLKERARLTTKRVRLQVKRRESLRRRA